MRQAASLCLVLAMGLIQQAIAASNGDISMCNAAFESWGCPNHINNDRTKCGTEGRIMDWVQAPVRSDAYTLRSGNGEATEDPTSYRPGQLMTVYVHTLKFGFKFRGLLLHAVDAQNISVGDWPTETEDFWHPPACPKAMLHNGAHLKSYSARFTFRAPPSGTGSLRFQALFKVGPANVGEFYWPKEDLILSEEDALNPEWVESEVGQSCEQACIAQGMGRCDAAGLNAISGSGAALTRAHGGLLDAFPAVADCSVVSPGYGPDGTSYYHAKTSCPVATPVSCNAYHPDVRRLCKCSKRGRRLLSESNQQPAVPRDSSIATRTASSGLAFVPLLAAVLSLVSMGGEPSPGRKVVVVVATFLMLSGHAEAHNWMLTPGRAPVKNANTVQPCLSRKPSEVHAQVGKGDSFTVKVATGHSGYHKMCLIKGEDEVQLQRKDFQNVLQEYLDEAPEGTPNLAEDEYWQRYHGGRNMSPDWAGGGVLKREVRAGDKFFLGHRVNNGNIWQYEPAWLREQGDRRVSYHSEKYPWLLAVYIFKQSIHDPGGHDATRWTLPHDAKSGHYVVHWIWAGYRNCIDVNYFADKSNMSDIDGRVGQGYVWTKTDHCQFNGPTVVSGSHAVTLDTSYAFVHAGQCTKGLISSNTSMASLDDCVLSCQSTAGCGYVAYEAVNNICASYLRSQGCPDDGPDGMYDAYEVFFGGDRGLSQCAQAISSIGGRLGVAVVPYSLPAGVTISDPSQEPIFKGYGAHSDWATLAGTDTVSKPEWADWKTIQHADKSCAIKIFTNEKSQITLRDAVLACSEHKCKGVVWKQDGQSLNALYVPGSTHTFEFCGALELQAAPGFRIFFKDVTALPDPLLDGQGFFVKFSFQPESQNNIPADGFIFDNGKVFGADAGAGQPNFGWNCPTESLMKGEGSTNGTQVNIGARYEFCNGVLRKWSVQVPNGAYKVTVLGSSWERFNRGCTFENTRFLDGAGSGIVFVHDNMFDFSATGQPNLPGNRMRCNDVRTLVLEQLTTEEGMKHPRYSAWLPASTNAYWQRELDVPSAVGQVDVRPPAGSRGDAFQNYFESNWNHPYVDLFTNGQPLAYDNKGGNGWSQHSCRSRFLFSGADCVQDSVPQEREQGQFTEADQGYTVLVGTTPCTGPSCTRSTGDTECVRSDGYDITMPRSCKTQRLDEPGFLLCPMIWDCQGAVGKYVKVLLKGKHRIFDADVRPRYQKPPAPAPNALVCYGLRPQEGAAIPVPIEETVTSNDINDPIFYSTCFIREAEMFWETTGEELPLLRSPWKFAGGCLDCTNYAENMAKNEGIGASHWIVSDQCFDCHLGNSPLEAKTSAVVSPLNSSPTKFQVDVWGLVAINMMALYSLHHLYR